MVSEMVDASSHLLNACIGVVTHKRGEVDLMEALFPYLGVVIFSSVLGDDISSLLLYLFVSQRKGILRKELFKFVHGFVYLSN